MKTLRKVLCTVLALVLTASALCIPTVSGDTPSTAAVSEQKHFQDPRHLLDELTVPERRAYVEEMIDFYLLNNQMLYDCMEDGSKTVLFMFEGASNSQSPYSNYGSMRDQAVHLVMRGWEIIYLNGHSCTLPDHPDVQYGVYPSAASPLDGIYMYEAINHLSPNQKEAYAAFHVITLDGDGNIPCVRLYKSTKKYTTSVISSGIDIHSRMIDYAGEDNTVYNSTGCMVHDLRYGQYKSFVVAASGMIPGTYKQIDGQPGMDYQWQAPQQYVTCGYLVIDRQLAVERLKSGKQMYGDYPGSTEALTAYSKTMRDACLAQKEQDASTLTINVNALGTREKGSTEKIKGTITSNYPIVEAKSEILYESKLYNVSAVNTTNYNSNSYRSTITPNAKQVSLENTSLSSLAFGNLPNGDYTLRVIARDASGVTKYVDVPFSVRQNAAQASTLALNVNKIGSLACGSSYNITGRATSNYTIKQAEGEIYSEGKLIQRYSCTTSTNDLDLKSSLVNSYIFFGPLEMGTYQMRIKVVDASGVSAEDIQTFTVTGNPNLTVSVDPIGRIDVGSTVDMTGTVTAKSVIASVKAEIIYNASVIRSYTDYPNCDRFDINLSRINSYLHYETLPGGSYTLRVTAVDTLGNTAVSDQTFTVDAPYTPPAPSTLAVALDALPEMTEGDTTVISGSVTSNYTIKTVTADILSASEVVLQTTSYQPDTLTVGLGQSPIQSALSFGALAAGEYRLRITAEDELGTVKTAEKAFTVKAAPASVLDIPEIGFIPMEAESAVKGSISSASRITEVSAQILSGTMIKSSSTVHPDAYNVDLASSGMDEALGMDKLIPGNYSLLMKITDETGEETNVTRTFTVTQRASASLLKVDVKKFDTVKKGSVCSIEGSVRTGGVITAVTGEILSGITVKKSVTVKPGTDCLDISDSAIGTLNPGSLAAGSYTLRITAVDSNGVTVIRNFMFKVQ